MEMRSRLRVGLIGCGNVAVKRHAPALSRIPAVEAAAVADPLPGRRQMALSALGLPAAAGYASHAEMLAARPLDYAVVSVPPAYRHQIMADCARHGVHVISEKPIATVPAEARTLRDVMRAAGLKFGMVHNYLFYPEYRTLRRLILDGAVGRVRHVTLNFMGVPDNPGAQEYQPLWRHNLQTAGGGVLMDMIHAFYVAEFLMDQPVQAVSAVVDNLAYAGSPVEDLALVHLYFREGYATINMGWGLGPGGVEVTGMAGRMLAFYDEYGTGPFAGLMNLTVINGNGRHDYTPRTDHDPVAGFTAIHRDFAEAIRQDGLPVASAASGQRCLEAALGAYLSAVQGSIVTLPLAPDHPVYAQGVAGLAQISPWVGNPLVERGLFGLRPAVQGSTG